MMWYEMKRWLEYEFCFFNREEYLALFFNRVLTKTKTINLFQKIYTVMPLSAITVALFPVWKWARGQLLFTANEIEYASCDAENCWRRGSLLCEMKV
jgi:hypothetical protein